MIWNKINAKKCNVFPSFVLNYDCQTIHQNRLHNHRIPRHLKFIIFLSHFKSVFGAGISVEYTWMLECYSCPRNVQKKMFLTLKWGEGVNPRNKKKRNRIILRHNVIVFNDNNKKKYLRRKNNFDRRWKYSGNIILKILCKLHNHTHTLLFIL